MEILQTIWTALTTENIMLTNIITSFLMFIELTVSMLLFTTILNINVNKKQKFLYVLILGIIGFVTLWTIPAPYYTFINIISCPILVYFLFKTSILKSIISQFIPYFVFVLVGNIVLKILLLLFNISSTLTLTIPIYKLTYTLSMYFVTFLIYLFFKKFHINISLYEKLKRKNNYFFILSFSLGFICLAIQAYTMAIYSDYISIGLTLSTMIIFIIYLIFTLYGLARTNKLEITTEILEQEKLYNKTITILYDNIRGFKHDFNNIVQAIGGYISTNNMDGLKDYHSDLLTDCQKVNNLAVLNPELINNPAVYGLLTSKYHRAEELGIKMNFEIFLDLETLKIKTYDLTRILGILLDNAIEASSKCDKKEIYITIRKDNKANRQLFIIENTYLNKDINIDRIFEKGYTSKTEEDNKNHGLGLWEVRQILKKNNNLNLFTTKNIELFKQQLEIYL